MGAGLVAETLQAYNIVGFNLLKLGDYRQARDRLRAGLAVAGRSGWETITDYLRSNLGEAEMELGHWADARDLFDYALKQSEAAYSAQRVWSLLRTGELLRRQGRLDEAGQLLDEVLPACENWDDCVSLGTCLESVALVRLARGDRAGAAAAMDRCIERWQSKAVMLPYDRALWRGVEVYLRVGRDDQARALLADLAVIANHTATPAACVYLADVRGLLAAHECRHGDAATYFKEVGERWHAMGCLYEEARARRHRAESLFRTDEPAALAEAERELDVARTIFERLGAQWELEAVAVCYPPETLQEIRK
jgi:tetratricopeptide (TPR) repeat protein